MDDDTHTTLHTTDTAWLRFSLAFKDATSLCRHIRQSEPDVAALSRLLRAFLSSQDAQSGRILQKLTKREDISALFNEATNNSVQRALDWQSENDTHHLLGMEHAAYPRQLLNTDFAPPLLYARGSLEALKYPLVAVVGSRKASHAAMNHTRSLCQELANRGLGVVSGLAMGIDAAAHEGAINATVTEHGPTIAVAATPANRVYPKRHLSLAQRIVDSGGLILTEYPLDSPTLPWHFPRRNRIISGVSMGVVIAEAALPSGSLTTATHAINQGREVMAVPGSVQNPQARGCHALIKQGAALVETAEDVIDTLGSPLQRHLNTLRTGHLLQTQPDIKATIEQPKQSQLSFEVLDLSPSEQTVLTILTAQPATTDELLAHCDLNIPQLAAILGLLETRGLITTSQGGRYARC